MKFRSSISFSIILFFCCFPSFSMEKESSFIERLKNGLTPVPGSDNYGNHFPNLGMAQEEFYAFCEELDKNLDIQRPVVAIFGGSYGLRAAEVLMKTKRVTVVLNDLVEEQLKDIKKWALENNFNDRLILVGGSFFNIHLAPHIKTFFSDNPVAFDAILAANVFHFLSPEEFIKGLLYSFNHLKLDGSLFFMTSKTPTLDPEERIANAIRADINKRGGSNVYSAQVKKDKSIELRHKNFFDALNLEQDALLIEYNKLNEIPFPGYNPGTSTVINPCTLIFDQFRFVRRNSRYFYTTPVEICKWAEVVGFSCLKTESINTEKSTRPHNYARLAKKQETSNETSSAFIDLIDRAKGVEEKINYLHDGKYFVFNIENIDYPCLIISQNNKGIFSVNYLPRFGHAKSIQSNATQPVWTTCDNCNKKFAQVFFCARCKQVKYCSKNCQTTAWNAHKKNCKAPLQK